MKKGKKHNRERIDKIHTKRKIQTQEKMEKIEAIEKEKNKKNRKKFVIFFLIWICIFSVGMARKALQNDTFYTIKIGELILNNGIDMMDHFSFHENLAYTYPHWLYDVFIYLCYKVGGFTGIHISSVVLFLILLGIIFKVNRLVTKDHLLVSAFATIVCALAISGFVAARAQLVSFLIFALEIYFIEMFLQNKKKRYLFGLLLLSTLICNVHLAVWPFYFIIFLPYLAEYVISLIASKIRLKKENKFVNFLKRKFVLEKNSNIKYIFIVMLLSIFTGLLTPLGDTPYTYTINMMRSNAQEYVLEHQMIDWIHSPFTIIIAIETIFLSLFSKAKLRDFFMICGLVFMSIISVRHISLLSLIGTVCFARLFSMFLENLQFDVDNKIISIFNKKYVVFASFVFALIIAACMLHSNLSEDFINKEMYPVDAVEYIKENVDIDNMKIFNEYNFGSYLLLHDIPVFIDSRADLYTAPYSGWDYDIFDDYHYIPLNYQDKFEFYGITHVLVTKEIIDEANPLYEILKSDINYRVMYEDDYFVLYEKLENSDLIITFN